MQKIFDAISVSDESVRENAMQVLVELARQEYESLQYHF
jgi:hypothetical protein